MSIEKPLPLMVGDKAYYTLTSYGPVEVTVEVPCTSDADVEFGLEMMLRDLGATMADLDDPAWVAEHFEGATSKSEVYGLVRMQVADMNVQMAEQQKLSKCVEALSQRLVQAVVPQHVAQAREAARAHFVQQLQAEGMTPEQFMMRSGSTPQQLEAMFDEQARQMVESDAALSALAHERKLKVDELEYGRLLGLSPAELNKVLEQARAAGQTDELREAALRSKAAQLLVAECSCTYHHESEAQAKARIAQLRMMQRQYDDRFGNEPQDKPQDKGFKLV